MPIPEKMIVVGGNIWKLTSGHGQVARLVVVVAHQASALAKCAREYGDDIDGWIEPLSESLIAAPKFIEFPSSMVRIASKEPQPFISAANG